MNLQELGNNNRTRWMTVIEGNVKIGKEECMRKQPQSLELPLGRT